MRHQARGLAFQQQPPALQVQVAACVSTRGAGGGGGDRGHAWNLSYGWFALPSQVLSSCLHGYVS